MIRMSASLIPDNATDVFGHRIEFRDQVVDCEGREVCVGSKGGVEVVDVCLVVAGVVDFHCLGVEVRLKSIIGVA